jgi:diguanylate cyclase (GGDEF)-like protein
MPELREVLQHLRGRGFQIAIDDLGEGFANLRMWSEVRPEFVKIDKHFANGIADDRMKYHFVRAMQDLAESCAATLIAEGIERVEDFDCVRSMGIACAQGYYIARPSPAAASTVSSAVQVLLREPALSVPPLRTQGAMTRTAAELARQVAPVPADATNDHVLARFEGDPALDVVPVVCAGQALGLINRESMIDRFARSFRKELYGRHCCQQFMDPSPLVADEKATLQELAMMLAQAPRHHLFDGFVVTREGRYLGVGSSRDLMAAITEMQISAARYANPLTQLPGNVPINEQIDRHLVSSNPFVAVYVDIDSFKPFNDTFGYRRGDDVILMLAKLLRDHVDDGRDYVGHIGGDDFFIVFQSQDWEQRCLDILHDFSQAIASMIGTEGYPMSGYMGENRRGDLVLQQLPTLSIGAVKVAAGEFESHREVAAAASDARKQAKKEAKRSPGQANNPGQFFVERRQSGTRRLADGAQPLFN